MSFVNFDLIDRIRDHINRTEKQKQLLENRQKWMKITSALDVLEDTSWAVEFYMESAYPENIKGKYLFTYGLLQAIFVQQDAANSIYYVFHNKYIDFRQYYPEVYRVREMRNDVVGHPTSRDNDKHFIHLMQCSLNKNGFSYLKSDKDQDADEIIYVDIQKAVEQVAQCINSVMENIDQILNDEFRKYIDKHKGRKMKDIFKTLHYAKEKALCDIVLQEWGYDTTKGMVKRCEDELCLRYGSVDAIDAYKYLLTEIHEIYDLIDTGVQSVSLGTRAKLKKYLLQTLFFKMEKLRSLAEETDEYFENYGNETPYRCQVAVSRD